MYVCVCVRILIPILASEITANQSSSWHIIKSNWNRSSIANWHVKQLLLHRNNQRTRAHAHAPTHTHTHTHAGSFSELVINLRHFARNSIDKFSVTRKTVNSNKNGKSQCDNLRLLNACEEVKFVSYSTHSGVCLLRQHFANWLRRHQCVHACVISSRTRTAADDALGNRFFFFVHFDFDWGQIAEICSTHLVDQWVEGLKVHAAFSPLDYLTWSLRLLLLLRCCWLANLNWSGLFF